MMALVLMIFFEFIGRATPYGLHNVYNTLSHCCVNGLVILAGLFEVMVLYRSTDYGTFLCRYFHLEVTGSNSGFG